MARDDRLRGCGLLRFPRTRGDGSIGHSTPSFPRTRGDGSPLYIIPYLFALVAQGIEQSPSKRFVAGSNPAWGT